MKEGKWSTNVKKEFFASQSLLKTAVLTHNNSYYNKCAFKNFKSKLVAYQNTYNLK